MFERMSGSQAVIGRNALIQILSPEGGLVAELKVSVFLLRESADFDLTAAKLAQAAREAKSFRRVQPRDPTTGRFMSAKVEGCEDGRQAESATECARAVDTTRRHLDGSWANFVPTDEVSGEMVVSDEDLAPSPEDILLACEESDELVFDDTDEDDRPDRYELMALAADAEIATRFSHQPLFRYNDFDDDFFGHAEDLEKSAEESVELVELVEDTGAHRRVRQALHQRRQWRDGGSFERDLEDAFRDRPGVLPGKFDADYRGPDGDRQRRAVLVARMRHARRAAQTWLTKPDWSDEAAALLEDEKVAELLEEISAIIAEAAA